MKKPHKSLTSIYEEVAQLYVQANWLYPSKEQVWESIDARLDKYYGTHDVKRAYAPATAYSKVKSIMSKIRKHLPL